MPPTLYAGGFQDFNAGPATDIAQNVVLGGDPTSDDGGGDGIIDLQWDDPVDPAGAPLGPAVIDTTGEITAAAPVARIPFDGTAGQTIRAIVDGIPSGSTDFILTLRDPSGAVLQSIDTGTSPEIVVQTLATTGRYTFEISGFAGDLGDFTFKVQPVLGSVAHDDRPQPAAVRPQRQLRRRSLSATSTGCPASRSRSAACTAAAGSSS